ncbi:MAG: hypothetical protein ACO1OB_10120 [Archangium sp.]
MSDATTTPPAQPAASAAPPVAFTHNKQPEWGIGLILHNLPDHWVLFFENGGEKKLLKKVADSMLTPAKLDANALAALTARASGRKPKAAPKPSGGLIKKKVPRGAGPRFATIASQLETFEKLYPGGFTGEAYAKNERGVAENNEDGDKEYGIALAQKTLSKEAFANGTTDSLFEAALAVLKATTIVFPIEGAIPFKALQGADREAAVNAIKDLMHGGGEYGERIAKFATALQLKDSKGVAKKVTWPLATVWSALLDPKNFTAVKPTAFAGQAQTLGLTVDKSAALNGEGYAKFLEVVTRTRDAIVAAGQQPRDLLDVYTFIWRTHADKPAEVPAAAPAPAP